MKKLFSLLFVAGALSIMSCGSSNEQAAADAAKAAADSTELFNKASSALPTEAPADTMHVDTAAHAPATTPAH